MKRKIYRSGATFLLGSVFLFGLGGCSSALNLSSWFPSWGQEEGYFAARKARQDARAIYRQACVYQERGQHQMALEEFKRVLGLDPNHAPSYNGMGISYDRLGNHSRAIGCYTAALKINPDLDYVHNNMGYSYLLQGDPARAAAAFRMALVLNRNNDRYRNNLGVAYAQMGKVELAMAEFASTAKPENTPAPAAVESLEPMPVAANGESPAEEKASAVSLAQAVAPSVTASVRETALNAAPAPSSAMEPATQVAAKAAPAASPASVLPVAMEKRGNEAAQIAVAETTPPEAVKKSLAAPGRTVVDAPAGVAIVKPAPADIPVREENRAVKVPAMPTVSAHVRAREPLPVQVALPMKQMIAAHAVAGEASVEVANGTGGKGVARWWGSRLRQQGVPVVQFTTASSNYAKTKIYYCEGYLQEAYQVAKMIPLYQEFERVAALEDGSAKIRVVIGRDVQRFAGREPEKKILMARAEL